MEAKTGMRVMQLTKMIICEHGEPKDDCNRCLAYSLYKICKYCKNLFLPSMSHQVKCPKCQNNNTRKYD